MTRRLRSLQRIVRLRHQQKRIEEVKLARLQTEEADLQAKRESLIASLNDDRMLHGLFVEDMAARLRRVTDRAQSIGHLKDVQVKQLLVKARHVRHAENLVDTISRGARSAEEKGVLDGLIEQLAVRRADTSLP